MNNELFSIFKSNFPYIVREDKTVKCILSDKSNTIIAKRDHLGELIGISVIHKNSVYLICVKEEYRNKGIGSELLKKSEKHIIESGYDTVLIGVGDDYIMPGIPTRTKPYDEVLREECIYPSVTDDAAAFFKKRGYTHSWENANCFDMKVDLKNVDFTEYSIGGTIDGITYRWAKPNDIPKIIECTDDAQKSFSRYYTDRSLYGNGNRKVLIAAHGESICGTLIVSAETEGKGLGSVGCTAIAHEYRGKHIAVNMVRLGTKYLKELGLNEGFLGYTYSGLDKMYGYAGYKICIYYMMAKKYFK